MLNSTTTLIIGKLAAVLGTAENFQRFVWQQKSTINSLKSFFYEDSKMGSAIFAPFVI
jgi:hypothetical protein